VPAPRGLRAIEEVVPKLGAKAGFPALRIGPVAKYDRPIEHLCGHLDVAPLKVPLRVRDGHYGLVLCFSLEDVDPPKLARELVRVTHPDGVIWVVVWKRDHLPAGALSWDEAQRVMLSTSWVDNKILSLGDQVYATRYVRRRRLGRT
jgi:SAM-dependent methyltransferase